IASFVFVFFFFQSENRITGLPFFRGGRDVYKRKKNLKGGFPFLYLFGRGLIFKQQKYKVKTFKNEKNPALSPE
ncbi:hypothetical protein, partial [Escherichia coli]|uniref:hypothetical protein n=1 Tax=Escherichia coli TaxID=562 RepID=UPI002B254783